ncbi:hypothetical protein [Rhizobium leguminosarum]|uniref:hypothetical protein n=1 Tax=Rhizobium leguminosarum TaxID=384 RepID=UPI001C95BBDF|nr:hypothetical protein [Rhizobium leguminosarum]MBY5699898.1 hypothetical protein [Rhizobium leguminosarum]
MTRITVMLMAALFCDCGTGHAEEPLSAFDLFKSRCLTNGSTFDRTASIARARGWRPLPFDLVISLVPMENADLAEGWMIGHRGNSQWQAIVVTRATVSGTAVESCTVAASGVDSAMFERDFFNLTDAEPVREERSQSHVHKLFTLNPAGRREMITLTSPVEPAGRDQLVASVVAEAQWEN